MIKCLSPGLTKLFLIKEMQKLELIRSPLEESIVFLWKVCLEKPVGVEQSSRGQDHRQVPKSKWRQKNTLLKQGQSWLLRGRGEKERGKGERETQRELLRSLEDGYRTPQTFHKGNKPLGVATIWGKTVKGLSACKLLHRNRVEIDVWIQKLGSKGP